MTTPEYILLPHLGYTTHLTPEEEEAAILARGGKLGRARSGNPLLKAALEHRDRYLARLGVVDAGW